MAPTILVACPKCGARPGDPCRNTKHRGVTAPAMANLHALRVGAMRRCACGAETSARSGRCVECTRARMAESARRSAQRRAGDRARAVAAVGAAIRNGTLVRPDRCECCGIRCRPDAHHFCGYRPEHYLTVRWLARKCHAREHARLRAAARQGRAA